MAEYIAVLTRTAEKQLDKLSDQIANKLLDAIDELSKIPGQMAAKS